MTEEEIARERFTAQGFSISEESEKKLEEFRRRIQENIMGKEGDKSKTANSRHDDRQIE